MKFWAECPHCGRKFFKYEEGATGKIDIKCPACKGFANIDLALGNQIALKVQLDDGAYMPDRAYALDAGMDIRTPVNVYVEPRGSAIIHTGVHIDVPSGYVGMLKSKSGLNVKHDIVSEGVIDAGYSGEIVVKLYNHGEEGVGFSRGEKVTQLVVMPVSLCVPVKVDSLEGAGERGSNGFGSTGA